MGTFYVSKADGDDTDSGETEGLARKTINGGLAIPGIGAGDSLLVKTGEYDERLDNVIPPGTSWTNAFTLKNFGTDIVTLKPPTESANAIEIRGADKKYIIIKDFKIDGINCGENLGEIGEPGGSGGQAVKYSTVSGLAVSFIRLDGLEIFDSPGSGVLMASGVSSQPDSCEIINCNIHDVAWHDVSGDNEYGYCIYNQGKNTRIHKNILDAAGSVGIVCFSTNLHPDNATITSNIIKNNGTAEADGKGIGLVHSNGTIIYNNIIMYNKVAGIGSFSSTNVKILNNLIFKTIGGTGIAIILFNASAQTGATVINNIFWRNTIDDWNVAPGTFSSNLKGIDPKFISEILGSEDFHLQANSPARDMGVTV